MEVSYNVGTSTNITNDLLHRSLTNFPQSVAIGQGATAYGTGSIALGQGFTETSATYLSASNLVN